MEARKGGEDRFTIETTRGSAWSSLSAPSATAGTVGRKIMRGQDSLSSHKFPDKNQKDPQSKKLPLISRNMPPSYSTSLYIFLYFISLCVLFDFLFLFLLFISELFFLSGLLQGCFFFGASFTTPNVEKQTTKAWSIVRPSAPCSRTLDPNLDNDA